MVNSKQAYADYLLKEKNYSLLTVRAYGDDIASFEKFITEHDTDAVLETVNYSQIRSWIVYLVGRGMSNTTVNRKVSSLKSFYKFLLRSKQILIRLNIQMILKEFATGLLWSCFMLQVYAAQS